MSNFSQVCKSVQLKPCTSGNWRFSKHCLYGMCKSLNCFPLVIASLPWTESVTVGSLRLNHTFVILFLVMLALSKFSLSSSLIFLDGWPSDLESSFSWQQSSSLHALLINELSSVSSFSIQGQHTGPILLALSLQNIFCSHKLWQKSSQLF